MALGAYLTIVAERQGPILSSVTQKGRENKILVMSVAHEIVGPRDPSSGRPNGKRAHKPLMCTKEVDRSSPQLYAILCGNENIRDARLDFWATTPMGLEKRRYSVELVNANISAITLKQPNTRSRKLAHLSVYEEISFTYQKITWTWLEGGITATDDWETPR